MKLKYFKAFCWIITIALFLMCTKAMAHFGMVIPSDSMVMQQDSRTISLTLSFSHPMERIGMDLAKPRIFKVLANGRSVDLLVQLNPFRVMGHPAWQMAYTFKRPGVYIVYMQPQPYWEPAEDCYIVHHTKTVVTAFGDDEGWDAELGVETEIVPLAKPFGLYAGNLFQGRVKLNGRPVPNAEVEVEFFNRDGKAAAPTDYMITQTVKADDSGIFSYAVPAAGWWGFAALNTSEQKMDYKGAAKDVEIGAVIWVRFHPWQQGGTK